jgi:threonine/homoserine/homoserine lactone efflux protein
MQASKGLAMEKRLCWAALGVAGLLLIVFLLDLILDLPFGLRSVSPAVDIIVMLCCALLGYLAWDALKDQL